MYKTKIGQYLKKGKNEKTDNLLIDYRFIVIIFTVFRINILQRNALPQPRQKQQ